MPEGFDSGCWLIEQTLEEAGVRLCLPQESNYQEQDFVSFSTQVFSLLSMNQLVLHNYEKNFIGLVFRKVLRFRRLACTLIFCIRKNG